MCCYWTCLLHTLFWNLKHVTLFRPFTKKKITLNISQLGCGDSSVWVSPYDHVKISYVLFSSDSSPESPDVTLLFLSHSPFSFALSHLMWYSQSLAHSRGTKTSGENSEIILRLVLDLIKLKTLLTGPKKHIHLQASCFLILLFPSKLKGVPTELFIDR